MAKKKYHEKVMERRKLVWAEKIKNRTFKQIAEKLGVSVRTAVNDWAYMKKHPEDRPLILDEDLDIFLTWDLLQDIQDESIPKSLRLKTKTEMWKTLQAKKAIQKGEEKRVIVSWGEEGKDKE